MIFVTKPINTNNMQLRRSNYSFGFTPSLKGAQKNKDLKLGNTKLRRSGAIIVFLISLFFISNSYSQADNITVSLVTCEPGSGIDELFGHSAIRVKNNTTGEDIAFNYGIFDFDTPGFVLKFMRGKLPYMLAGYDFSTFMGSYNQDKRGVTEQVLDLTSEQKTSLINFLQNNALPENREYKYDFFFDNCSTRIRDAFEKELGLDPANYVSKEDVTFRDLLHQYLKGNAWTKYGIDLIIGAKADAKASPSDQMFLPEKMQGLLADAKLKNQPLVSNTNTLLKFEQERAARQVPTPVTPAVVNGILAIIILALIALKKHTWLVKISNIWYILAFASSLLIVFLWFFTDHLATKTNWNILWLNPLYLFMLYKNNLNKKLVTFTLIALSILCLANTYFHFLPQAMPLYYSWFFIPLLVYNLFHKEKEMVKPVEGS
jgi:hypothetical protein